MTAQLIGAFATLTLLTKNSFLDEIKKQYVMTARAKGLSEARVLYGHVFRNAMLIVIAGFPALFLGIFFGSSLIIEFIFSLDGLGQLGYRAAVERDYPVIFGTLFAFGLIGLVVGIISDLMYVLVDPRIDFERRGADGAFAPEPAPLAELHGEPAGLLVAVDLPGPLRPVAFRRADRQRPADPDPAQRRVLHAGLQLLSRSRPSAATCGPKRNTATVEVQCLIVAGGSLDCWDDPEGIIAEVEGLGHCGGSAGQHGAGSSGRRSPTATTPSSIPAAWPPGRHPRRTCLGTDDTSRDVAARIIYGFRLSVTFALIVTVLTTVIGIAAGAVQGYFGGKTDLIFQRFIELWSSIPTLYVIIILTAVWQKSFWLMVGLLVLFGWTGAGRRGPGRVPAGAELRIRPRGQGAGCVRRQIMFRHVLPNAMVATLTLLPFIITGTIATLATLDYLGFGLPTSLPSLGQLTRQAQQNLQAPWLAFTAFFTFAVMLSLLVFIFEGVRDAFDPRKTVQMSCVPLEVKDLTVTFRQDGRLIEAVKRVSFTVAKGETVALVGESGSGKSVTALSTVGLLGDNAEVSGSDHLWRAPDGRRVRGRVAPGARQRDQLHLPGADDQPQPAAHDRAAVDRKPCPAPGADRGRCAGAGAGAFAEGRHP